MKHVDIEFSVGIIKLYKYLSRWACHYVSGQVWRWRMNEIPIPVALDNIEAIHMTSLVKTCSISHNLPLVYFIYQ